MPQTIKVQADVQIPPVPNFLRFSNNEGTIDVADVADEGLRALAAEWTKVFLANARARRLEARPSR